MLFDATHVRGRLIDFSVTVGDERSTQVDEYQTNPKDDNLETEDHDIAPLFPNPKVQYELVFDCIFKVHWLRS